MAHDVRAVESHRSRSGLLLLVLGALAFPACASGPPELPSPRPIIVFSGVRVHADSTEMLAVDRWTRRVQAEIGEDEELRMEVHREEHSDPPWEAVTFDGDEPVVVGIPRRAAEAETPYRIYAFLRYMDRRGDLDEWLPLEEDEDVEVPQDAFERERAIVDRVAAVWLLGRAIFDTAPFSVLDELVYAREFGYLDAYILTARSEEFSEARELWLAEDPGAQEEYRDWFRDTFEGDPPGWEDVTDEPDEDVPEDPGAGGG